MGDLHSNLQHSSHLHRPGQLEQPTRSAQEQRRSASHHAYLFRPLLIVATLLVLLATVEAARPGFIPQPPDTEGREPSTLLSGSFLPQEDIPVDLNHLATEEKLQRFFSHFKLPPGPCQERLICALSSDPARFAPVSNVFARALAPGDRLPPTTDPGAADSLDVDGEEEVVTRLERLQRAAEEKGRCAERYSGCPIRPEGLISETALQLWQWSAALTNVEFSTVEL